MIQPEITKEKSTTEETITILVMRLNQSIAELESEMAFPAAAKPHTRLLFKNVYKDIYELSRLTRATLSTKILIELNNWRKSDVRTNFVDSAVYFIESIYDELSESGMVDIRAQKTAVFPMDFYINRV